MGHYGDFEGQDNFEGHEHQDPNGRWTYTRGRAKTPEGDRILRDQKAVYDSAFPEHYEEHDMSKYDKPNKGIKRMLFGKY